MLVCLFILYEAKFMLTWMMVIEFYKPVNFVVVVSFETKVQTINMQDEQS